MKSLSSKSVQTEMTGSFITFLGRAGFREAVAVHEALMRPRGGETPGLGIQAGKFRLGGGVGRRDLCPGQLVSQVQG